MNKGFLISILLFSLFVLSCSPSLYTESDSTRVFAEVELDEKLHEKNSLEWWYYTGHLYDSILYKELGVEFVFFHFSPTRFKSYILVNIAVSDPESEAFYYDYKLIKLKDELNADLPLNFLVEKGKFLAGLNGANGNYSIDAKMRRHKVSFQLKTVKNSKTVMHDGTGYKKYADSITAGYYSIPRLKTTGKLQIKNQEYNVTGDLWYDRQWNCSKVSDSRFAWDWFSVQFDETKSDLMLYRIYQKGDTNSTYGGTYLNAKGEQIELKDEDIEIEELAHWKSHLSHRSYPIAWEVTIDKLNAKFKITSRMPNQELKLKMMNLLNVYYWEGMCEVYGKIEGQEVFGKSYVEITNRTKRKRNPKL